MRNVMKGRKERVFISPLCITSGLRGGGGYTEGIKARIVHRRRKERRGLASYV